jgi:hypothetical protein
LKQITFISGASFLISGDPELSGKYGPSSQLDVSS